MENIKQSIQLLLQYQKITKIRDKCLINNIILHEYLNKFNIKYKTNYGYVVFGDKKTKTLNIICHIYTIVNGNIIEVSNDINEIQEKEYCSNIIELMKLTNLIKRENLIYFITKSKELQNGYLIGINNKKKLLKYYCEAKKYINKHNST